MKKATKILIGLMIVAFTVTSAFAAIEKPDNYKKGNTSTKKIVRPVTSNRPATKRWDSGSGSTKGEHRGGAEAWEKLDEKELHQIFFYLYEHARDSAQPETCG
ncbi:MAG: hypothetical protein MH219_05525 [Marinobacter sp.]|nr:hypothetical protein [Marinobacter sp.]